MKFISQGISTKGWISKGGFHSPHKDSDLSWYPTETDKKIAEILQNATTSGSMHRI
jgi:alpha-glucoside transport system substrate-binding protein